MQEEVIEAEIKHENIKEMRNYHSAAMHIYNEHHDEFFDESNPERREELYREVYDLFEKMVRVVIPNYKLPENRHYTFPSTSIYGCMKFYHHIPDEDQSFSISFANVSLNHEGTNPTVPSKYEDLFRMARRMPRRKQNLK